MAIARFKDLCIDETDVSRGLHFWSQLLGLRIHRDSGGTGDDEHARLEGATPQQRVWINQVPEAKAVKNRVHLDVLATSLAELEALGARQVEDFERWTVMAAPDGQEFCAFLREEVPEYRLKDLVVDSQDPGSIAQWWHAVLGGELGRHDVHPWWWVDAIPGAPFESMDFVEVPEPKATKNRVHWDVQVDSAAGVQALLEAGASLLRANGGDISWHVMADPDGNEFCVFDD
jgi:catechol 2,3-dioxygenase-like lactoylglutathione lyase family enzyme